MKTRNFIKILNFPHQFLVHQSDCLGQTSHLNFLRGFRWKSSEYGVLVLLKNTSKISAYWCHRNIKKLFFWSKIFHHIEYSHSFCDLWCTKKWQKFEYWLQQHYESQQNANVLVIRSWTRVVPRERSTGLTVLQKSSCCY